jgi:hypothetical protein
LRINPAGSRRQGLAVLSRRQIVPHQHPADIAQVSAGGNADSLNDKSDAELLSDYCEAQVAAMPDPNR